MKIKKIIKLLIVSLSLSLSHIGLSVTRVDLTDAYHQVEDQAKISFDKQDFLGASVLFDKAADLREEVQRLWYGHLKNDPYKKSHKKAVQYCRQSSSNSVLRGKCSTQFKKCKNSYSYLKKIIKRSTVFNWKTCCILKR